MSKYKKALNNTVKTFESIPREIRVAMPNIKKIVKDAVLMVLLVAGFFSIFLPVILFWGNVSLQLIGVVIMLGVFLFIVIYLMELEKIETEEEKGEERVYY